MGADQPLYKYVVYHQLTPGEGHGMTVDYPLEYAGRGHRTLEKGGTVVLPKDDKWRRSPQDEAKVSKNITDLHLFSELFGTLHPPSYELRKSKIIHRLMEAKGIEKTDAEETIDAYINTVRTLTKSKGMHGAELFDSWVMSKFTGQKAIDMRAELPPAVYYTPSKPKPTQPKKKKAARARRINAEAVGPVTQPQRLEHWYKAPRKAGRPPHDSAQAMYKGNISKKISTLLSDSRILHVNPTDPSQGLIGDEWHQADYSAELEHRVLNGYLAIDLGSDLMQGRNERGEALMRPSHYAVHPGSKSLFKVPYGSRRKALVILANQQSHASSDQPHHHRVAGFLQVLHGLNTVLHGPGVDAGGRRTAGQKWGQENGFHQYLPRNVRRAVHPFMHARTGGPSGAFKSLFTDKYFKSYRDFHRKVENIVRTRDIRGLSGGKKSSFARDAFFWRSIGQD